MEGVEYCESRIIKQINKPKYTKENIFGESFLELRADMEIENLEERHLNVSQFLEARSAEIGHFTHQLYLKKNGSNKLVYQMVRKHLRRRAMSHNRYRIPKRVREKVNEQELDVIEKTQDPIRCRKHLRKPKLLMNAYIRRSRSEKWMETHLWHSKRMKMLQYFSYKIAETPNEKGTRACYRFAKNECIVYDKSYYEIIYLEGTREQISQFLNKHLEDKQAKTLLSIKNFGCVSSDLIDIFRNDKATLIGPAQFIWTSQSELAVIIHPGQFQEWESILTIYQEETLKQEDSTSTSSSTPFKWLHVKDNFNMFELSGPQCMAKLHFMLTNLGLSEQEVSNLHPLAGLFQTLTDSNSYPKNHIIELKFISKVQKKLCKPPYDFSQIVVDQNQLNQKQLNDSLLKMVSYAHNVQSASIELFSSIKQNNLQDFISRFRTINRGRYTHKKVHKIAKKQKIQALANAKQEPKTPKKLKQDVNQQIDKGQELNTNKQTQTLKKGEDVEEEEMKTQKKILFSKEEGEENIEKKEVKIVIIFQNTKKFQSYGSGITIISELGRGNLIWRILSFISCKAIGLNERTSILHEGGAKVFPDDFPLTSAFSQLNKQRMETSVTKYFRKPKSKRVNFLRINSPFPFTPNFDYLLTSFLGGAETGEKIKAQNEDLLDVKIRMMGRGRPTNNAYICLPLHQDLDFLEKMIQDVTHNIYSIHDEPTSDVSQTEDIAIPEPFQIKTSRQIIGFLSHGNFSFLNGKGTGRGQVLKYYLQNLNQMQLLASQLKIQGRQDGETKQEQKQFICLIRNTTSRNYYAANLFIE